jgi:hypothetical protein
MALTSGLVSYYSLQGNSNDAAGGGNNGTDTAITYSTGNGKISQGAGFDGSTSYIGLGDPANLHNANLSTSFWFNSTNTTGYQSILCKGNSAAVPWVAPYATLLIRLDWPVNNIEVGLSNASTYTPNNWSSAPIATTGVWYHLVFTYDGTSGILYINGTSQGSLTYSTTLSYNTQAWNIGADTSNAPPVENFAGAIDELGIWNRALTSAEVTSLYNSGAGLAYPFGLGSLGKQLFVQQSVKRASFY